VEDSPWKARQVLKMLSRHDLRPRVIAEVGCGAGEILRQLHDRMEASVRFVGYEISPQAYELARRRESDRLSFHLHDLLCAEAATDGSFDPVLAMECD
jgi:ubiquinone/menaquinone biosynthesis C-methylase UbiE